MNRTELIAHTKRLVIKARDEGEIAGTYAEACEFLRTYAGANNSFLETIKEWKPTKMGTELAAQQIEKVLSSFLSYLEAGLYQGMSPERQAQIDVVSDFLGMAHELLNTKDVHPAAPAVLVGATLEEFLRTWVESSAISLGARKPGIEAYSQVLREAELITKQDAKDITSWAGLRNHAAHGEWHEVEDRARVQLALEGVNPFMRKYAAA
jgi:hypothetical protein